MGGTHLRKGAAHPKPALKGRNITKDGCSPSVKRGEASYNMGQSLVKNYIHLVFSTKYREPLIHPPFENELHSYLGGVCKNLDCQPIKIGGYTDHVHILCMLSKKIALMKLLEEIKSHSSKWMKTRDESLLNFYWQNGYGAFSVNPVGMDRLIAYIENQHAHHDKKTFKDEYRSLLKRHQLKYDERYVWD